MNLLILFSDLWTDALSELHEFVRITNQGLSSEFKKFGQWLNQRTAEMNEVEANRFADIYYDDLAMIRDLAPQMLHYAQYLVLFGVFEHEAGHLCRTLRRDGKASREPPDNLYLHKVEDFLRQHAGFRKKVFGKAWGFMLRARYPRNAIAHNRGRLKKNGQVGKAKAFIRGHPKLHLNDWDTVVVEEGFCEDMLEKMEAAMQSLIGEARTKY